MKFNHKPILVNQILEAFRYLNDKEKAVFVDGTLGLGGHSLKIARQIIISKSQILNNLKNQNSKPACRQASLQIIGIDKDSIALKTAKQKIKSKKLEDYFTFIHDDFCNIKKILEDLNVPKADGALLDLGVSSMQLDDKTRGFSFEDPSQVLDMRMDQSSKKNARSILNNYSKKELERVLKSGEEKYFKKIAANIIETRREKNIKTVSDLTDIINRAYPKRVASGRRNIATDTFRALRLEVNDEISNLAQSIEDIVDLLSIGSKVAIITFHSLEDRIVKHKFRELENPCLCPPKQPYCTCDKKPLIRVLTKKPIIPPEEEVGLNPRSRSAKLRIAQRI